MKPYPQNELITSLELARILGAHHKNVLRKLRDDNYPSCISTYKGNNGHSNSVIHIQKSDALEFLQSYSSNKRGKLPEHEQI